MIIRHQEGAAFGADRSIIKGFRRIAAYFALVANGGGVRIGLVRRPASGVLSNFVGGRRGIYAVAKKIVAALLVTEIKQSAAIIEKLWLIGAHHRNGI